MSYKPTDESQIGKKPTRGKPVTVTNVFGDNNGGQQPQIPRHASSTPVSRNNSPHTSNNASSNRSRRRNSENTGTRTSNSQASFGTSRTHTATVTSSYLAGNDPDETYGQWFKRTAAANGKAAVEWLEEYGYVFLIIAAVVLAAFILGMCLTLPGGPLAVFGLGVLGHMGIASGALAIGTISATTITVAGAAVCGAISAAGALALSLLCTAIVVFGVGLHKWRMTHPIDRFIKACGDLHNWLWNPVDDGDDPDNGEIFSSTMTDNSWKQSTGEKNTSPGLSGLGRPVKKTGSTQTRDIPHHDSPFGQGSKNGGEQEQPIIKPENDGKLTSSNSQ